MTTLLRDAFKIHTRIDSVEAWFEAWPPEKGLAQWAEGKSAKELAKVWCRNSGDVRTPPGLDTLFQSSDHTRGLAISKARGEEAIHFDKFPGPRMCDLRLEGTVSDRPLLVHIEAKADEPFGDTIEISWRKALAKRPNSKTPKRISNLAALLFDEHGITSDLETVPGDIRSLRYQLLYSIGAALVDAGQSGFQTVLFVVHELLPADPTIPFQKRDGSDRYLDTDAINENKLDLNRFVARLSKGQFSSVPQNTIIECGLFYPPNDLSWDTCKGSMPVNLLIGKALDETRQR